MLFINPFKFMKKNIFLLATGLVFFGGASASSCMVLGDKSAMVKSVEGERSPVFVTSDCQALRLMSGKAVASWVGRDGKPRMIPITAQGVDVVPQAGAEERSVMVVWNELSTKRERQQPAYMRNIGDERPPKVYAPKEGVVLFVNSESETLITVENAAGEIVFDRRVNVGDTGVIPRNVFLSDQIFKIRTLRAESMQEWRWRVVNAAETANIDQSMETIDATISDLTQVKMMRAMMFEQIKIRVNMELALQDLR